MRSLVRRLGATAAAEGTGHLSDGMAFAAGYLLRLLRVGVMLSLWRMVFAKTGNAGGMTLEMALTYSLAAEAFADFLHVRTNVEGMIWHGSLVMRLLRPVRLVECLFAECLGRWLAGIFLFSLPLLLVAPALGVDPWPASLVSAGCFAASLALAIVTGFALDLLFAGIAVALNTDVWAVDQYRQALPKALSGSVVPFALLPWGLGVWLQWTPFAALASAPLTLYVGLGNPAFVLPLQAFWAAVLGIAAARLWEGNRDRLASFGG